MKTPTPEEVRNKIATKHGFEDWRHVISFHGGFDSSRYVQLYNLTNEAMRDYAEALYTERIKKAGQELYIDREIDLVVIDNEYYVIDLKFNTHNYVGMVVCMNGDGSGKLKKTVEPKQSVMAGATYKIIASSKELFAEPHQVIDRKIFQIIDDVKQAASLVVAKEKKHYDDMVELAKQEYYDLQQKYEQKDKEIEELMKFKKLFENHRDSIITTNTKTK